MVELGTEGGAPLSAELTDAEDGAATVRLSGELDVTNVEALQRLVAPVLARAPNRLVVDVGELGFADSSAIALWVRWAGAVSELQLIRPSPLLRRVLDSMGLAELFGVSA